MKTIGLLGGMSWESTLSYYKLLNEGVRDALGGFHNAKIVMQSVDYDKMQKFVRAGKWDEAGYFLAEYAKTLQVAGADLILICTNTMHKVLDIIQKEIDIPIIHIAQATADALKEEGCKKTILLGTGFTIQENFNKKIIETNGIKVVTPNDKETIDIDRIIFNELVLGKILENSKKRYIEIIENLYRKDNQIDSVILGCTEIGLLIKQNDVNLKIFDTTLLHVNKALKIILKS